MTPPIKPSDRSRRPSAKGSGSDSETDDKSPSATLWVGHLSPETDEADLLSIFKGNKALDCVLMHAGRPYAFVYFARPEDAATARDALQGAKVRGATIKIEFARPAKPGKHLWIGGISSSVTKEQLEDEFSKFGKIEDYKFLRDRNSAFIDYCKIEDAIAAYKNMNGKHIAGNQIRVDFQRSKAPDGVRSIRDSSLYGSKRPVPGGRRDGQPSKVLWIGYPPSTRIDEQMLHGAMILFGEIERIKCFPTRNYSFVQFRSVDEARRAKEGLQGRLFNDPRIQILFSNSELAPHEESAPLLPGFRVPGSDIFLNDAPYRPLDYFSIGGSAGTDSFSGRLPSSGVSGSNVLTRLLAQGLGTRRESSAFDDSDFPGNSFDGFNDPNLRPTSFSASDMLLPAADKRPPYKHVLDKWDGFDSRDSKRPRLAGSSPPRGSPFHPMTEREGSMDRIGRRAERHTSPGSDYCWRGIIAKGGSPVCRARCVPIDGGIESPFPEMVNCSARTGLDMLTKHYAEAIGFEIVFFLPDSEDEFAPYTEFLRYLGLKNRAGVAKFEDGTTLFLVPPSDFLTKVLKVSGPERLYGVVLKLPKQPEGHNFVEKDERQALKVDYGRDLRENSIPRATVPKAEQHVGQSVSTGLMSNPGAGPHPEVSLTPELIASLASLIPTNNHSSASGPFQMPSTSSLSPAPYAPAALHENSNMLQGWRHEQQGTFSAVDQVVRLSEQIGYQFSNQANLTSQFPAHSSVANLPGHPVQPVFDGSHIPDPPLNVAYGSTIPSQSFNGYTVPQAGHFSGSQTNPQYQVESAFPSHHAQSSLQTADATGFAHFSNNQQLNNPPASTLGQIGNALQPQILPPSSDTGNPEYSSQMQQLQMALSNSAQATSDGEADKNQRYQSTLQLAASLLLQIQQKQQTNAPAAQGRGN